MAPTSHKEAMSVLLESAKFSDLILEAYSNRIDLEEDECATVKRMISYMYTFDYEDEKHQHLESVDQGLSREGDQVTGATTADESETIISQNENPSALFSSVRVYAIADKYDISPLKELARQRFCDWAATNWLHEDFCDIVQEVFSSTPDSDRGLRDVVIQIVAKHAKDLIQKDKFRRLMVEIGDLGLGILCQVLQQHSEEVSSLESQLTRLQADKNKLKVRIKEVEQLMSRQEINTESMVSRINDLGQCRHCETAFTLTVEGYSHGGVAFRCKECRTRFFTG